MTKDMLTRENAVEYGVPVVTLAAVIVATLFLPNIYLLTVPVVALGVGVVLRPRSVGTVWVSAYVLLALAAIGTLALGRDVPKIPDVHQGFEPASLFFNGLLLFLYMAAFVYPFVWVGRWLRTAAEQHRHQGASPA